MEIFVSYFWIIKVLAALATIGVGYKLYKSKFKSKFWWVVAIAMVLFQTYNPVKIHSDVNSQQVYTNQQIQNQKVLPEKVIDNSFTTKTQDVPGISNEDLK